MLVPQYSLRQFIGFVTVSGFACLIVAAAVHGQLWAFAVMIAMFALGLTIVVHGALFGLVMLLGRVKDGWRKVAALPPQGSTSREPPP